MGDTAISSSVHVQPQTEDKREPLPRQVYLALRLKELVAELQSLVMERQKLNLTLKDHDGASSKDVRKMRERRGYLAIRINVLRAEQQGLIAEREEAPPTGKLDVGGDKRTARGA
jgi:hypothetical protein